MVILHVSLLRLFLSATAVSFLGACASLEWSTLQYAKGVELDDVDPETARFAVRPPIEPFDAAWAIGVEISRADDATVKKQFWFVEETDSAELDLLPRQARRGRTRLYRMWDKSIENWRDLLARVDEIRRTPGRTKADTSMTLRYELHTLGDPTSAATCDVPKGANYSVWFRVSGRERYRVLVDDKRLDKINRRMLAGICENFRKRQESGSP